MMALRGPKNSFYVVGSEFVGEVVDFGPAVTEFQVGDRVIGNGSYPFADAKSVLGGIPTNNGSKEYQIFHEAKLIKIPPNMPDEVAAAFPIGAQTSYSMLRKLNLQAGERVLVTAAKSNTSLFAINALRKYPVQVFATSTSLRFEQELREMGVQQLIQIDPQQATFIENESLKGIVLEKGGFDAVIDPFCDLHLVKAISVMGHGGRYITCGYFDQYSHLTGQESSLPASKGNGVMLTAIMGNLQIIGNCLGQTADLRQAIADYAAQAFHVVIDSVWNGHQVGAFFDRTFNAPERFGKVIYKYQ
jgi:NADPH:quinone reductase-like Zn-dependent oxidoreductase